MEKLVSDTNTVKYALLSRQALFPIGCLLQKAEAVGLEPTRHVLGDLTVFKTVLLNQFEYTSNVPESGVEPERLLDTEF